MSGEIRVLAGKIDPAEAERMAACLAASFDSPENRWSADAIASLLASGGTAIAADAGVALMRVAGDEAELLSIAVDPAGRGQGLGSALLARLDAEAARQGAQRLFLEVAAGNKPALALYRRAGFAEAGVRRGYYRHTDGAREDALILAKDLPA